MEVTRGCSWRPPTRTVSVDPYTKRGDGILELPIGVTRDWTGRLPFIGTSVAMLGVDNAARLTRAIVGRPLVNLELHGIDAADAKDDGLDFLAPHQPDLRRTAQAKLDAIGAAIDTLKNCGYRFGTLGQITDAIG